MVVSVFVNPTQFGPNEDLEACPRDFERDSRLCEELGADLIFHPEPEEMYHDPHAFVSIDLLSETLCGKTRPIHFKGVCTVVSKLFNIVTPDIVMIISGIVAVNKEKVITSGLLVLGIVALHNLIGMLTGLGIAKIFHIEYNKATAIAIEVGMQNSGLAVSLATANFAANPLATLPGAIFSVWHNISGSIFAGIRRRGMES